MESTVTFGKYKGQPISTLLGDTNYLEWLKQQQWFAANPLFNVIIQKQHVDKDEPTPEHNKMQNRFLCNDFCTKFVAATWPDVYVSTCLSADQWDAWSSLQTDPQSIFVASFKDKHNYFPNDDDAPWFLRMLQPDTDTFNTLICLRSPTWRTRLTSFEPTHGGDVHLEVDGFSAGIAWSSHVGLREPRSIYQRDALNPPFNSFPERKSNADRDVIIEVKPTVGDDYPCVLRRMKKEMEYRRTKRSDVYHVLYIDHFQSEATSRDQLKAIFRLDGINVIFNDELQGAA